MSGNLSQLNAHLFSQLERLGNSKKSGDKLREEIDRSKAVALLAREVISNGRLALDAQLAFDNGKIKASNDLLEVNQGL